MNPLAIPQLIWAVLMTILGGVFYSLVMMTKARQEGESPDGLKFLRTVIWGALVGSVAYYMGLDFSAANEYLYIVQNGFVVIIVDQLASAIWRQHGQTIQKWLENKKTDEKEDEKEGEKKEEEKKEEAEAKEPEKPKDAPKEPDAPKPPEPVKPAEEPKEAPKE